MEHRLFHAIVIAGCAIPASCARIEEQQREQIDSAVTDAGADVADMNEEPLFRLDAEPGTEPDTSAFDADAADVRHPSITK